MRSVSFVALAAAAVTSIALLATPTLAAQATPVQDTSAVVTAGTATPTNVRFATFNVRTWRGGSTSTCRWSRHKEKSYDALRGAQANAICAEVAPLTGTKPILFGGDINSWRTKAGSHAPYNYLTSQGFADATVAPSRVNAQYPTVNHWKSTFKANAKGRQVALDVVLVKRGQSFSSYENVGPVSSSEV